MSTSVSNIIPNSGGVNGLSVIGHAYLITSYHKSTDADNSAKLPPKGVRKQKKGAVSLVPDPDYLRDSAGDVIFGLAESEATTNIMNMVSKSPDALKVQPQALYEFVIYYLKSYWNYVLNVSPLSESEFRDLFISEVASVTLSQYEKTTLYNYEIRNSGEIEVVKIYPEGPNNKLGVKTFEPQTARSRVLIMLEMLSNTLDDFTLSHQRRDSGVMIDRRVSKFVSWYESITHSNSAPTSFSSRLCRIHDYKSLAYTLLKKYQKEWAKGVGGVLTIPYGGEIDRAFNSQLSHFGSPKPGSGNILTNDAKSDDIEEESFEALEMLDVKFRTTWPDIDAINAVSIDRNLGIKPYGPSIPLTEFEENLPFLRYVPDEENAIGSPARTARASKRMLDPSPFYASLSISPAFRPINSFLMSYVREINSNPLRHLKFIETNSLFGLSIFREDGNIVVIPTVNARLESESDYCFKLWKCAPLSYTPMTMNTDLLSSRFSFKKEPIKITL